MRELVLKMSMTLDGFVGGPKGEIDWIFSTTSPDSVAWTVSAISGAGLHLMGSRTFRDMAAFWPTSTQPVAAPMNSIPKAVFSRSGLAAGTSQALVDARADDKAGPAREPQGTESWRHPRVLSGDLAAEIARLKAEPGAFLLAHGGAAFARSLVETDLVDEYRLLVHPIALGSGLPIFARRHDLRLVEARAFTGGAVAHVYRRVT